MPPSTLSLQSLPPEILLEILPHIPYTPSALRSLHLTSTTLHRLLQTHERALVRAIHTLQLPPLSHALFPNLPTSTFPGLATLLQRLATLDRLHTQWLRITSHGPDLAWLQGRWEAVHKIGLLLLYRLHDAGDYARKAALLRDLPAPSLACLMFKLVASVKILRVYGPCPVHAAFAGGDVELRGDVELALEEMLLGYGPEFFVALLKAGEACSKCRREGQWAVDALEKEIAGMIERQTLSPPTLTSCLRRAFAARAGCHIRETLDIMWEILAGTPFDRADEPTIIKVVRGDDLDAAGVGDCHAKT